MKTQTYLLNRNNVYYFRRWIPRNLRAILGKNEVVRSLKTSDLRTARRAAIIMADELEQLFERIQNGADLLSKKEEELVYGHILKTYTLNLKKEALEEFSEIQPEDSEWKAFHARTFRQEVLKDLKFNRLETVKDDVCFDSSCIHNLT